jgi:hypothetical protein
MTWLRLAMLLFWVTCGAALKAALPGWFAAIVQFRQTGCSR